MKKLQATVLAFGLVMMSTPSMALFHGMGSMSDSGMYNLMVGGLAGRDDAKGIDEEFREMNEVNKVHVDFKNGMVMIWVNQGAALDETLTKEIVEKTGFQLEVFDRPE